MSDNLNTTLTDNKNLIISGDINKDFQTIKSLFGNSFDLATRSFYILGKQSYIFVLDGMCDELKIIEGFMKPIMNTIGNNETDFYETIQSELFKGVAINKTNKIDEIALKIISGCLVVISDNVNFALIFPNQGFPKKSISEPTAEQNERGSQEGFNDNFKDNATLLRRKLRTPNLVIEEKQVGSEGNTPVLVCYLSNRVDKKILKKVLDKLENINLDAIFGSGYIKPFLDSARPSLFSDCGLTERPDTLASMLLQGRIGIICDGTPFALIVPYLFIDYFHAFDDNLTNSYYSFFMRSLRILCFFIATVLPGFFVAICLYHPEIMPFDIMYGISAAINKTPFPIMIEALIIHFIYEIVREAGLRMPRSAGQAVSIVGALVIGDAAVTAGLIAAPMLIIVALTAICSSVIVRLYEPVAIIRFIFIIVGGFTGLYGIMLCLGLVAIDICSVSPYKIPLSAPVSPYAESYKGNIVFRKKWTKSNNSNKKIKGLKF